jgi:hypothetical protein
MSRGEAEAMLEVARQFDALGFVVIGRFGVQFLFMPNAVWRWR